MYRTGTECQLMLNYWGREEIKADEEQHITVLTLFLQPAHHSSIMYDYKAIPQRLLLNGLRWLLCRAEKAMKTEET